MKQEENIQFLEKQIIARPQSLENSDTVKPQCAATSCQQPSILTPKFSQSNLYYNKY